jgi:hypothetical protein
MFGASEYVQYGRPWETPKEAPAGDAAQYIVMAQGDSADPAANQEGAKVPDDRFDFRQLGHLSGSALADGQDSH